MELDNYDKNITTCSEWPPSPLVSRFCSVRLTTKLLCDIQLMLNNVLEDPPMPGGQLVPDRVWRKKGRVSNW